MRSVRSSNGGDSLRHEFVDRTAELKHFREMLEGNAPPLLCICGPSGIGKSSLLAMMVHETKQRSVRSVHLTWTGSRNYEYSDIIRKIRDDLGSSAFEETTHLLDYFAKSRNTLNVRLVQPESIKVMTGARLRHSTITGGVTGARIDVMRVDTTHLPSDVPETERQIRLTDTFVASLKSAAGNGTIVLFLDAAERMTQETTDWLQSELFGAIREDKLPSVCVVVCGELVPQLDRRWNDFAATFDLGRLSCQDVRVYIEKRGIPRQEADLAAGIFYSTSKGNTLMLAEQVDGYLSSATQAQKRP